MAVKYPLTYNEYYLGDMSELQAQTILKIRDTPVINALKHMIFNFPTEMVMESIDTGRSIRSLLKETGEDYTQYIGELRDYQTIGTAFMYTSPRSVIADGVGLGKTVEIAALINYLKMKNEMTRFLIAVDTSALGQTTYELIRFTGLNIIAMPSLANQMLKMISSVDWRNIDGIVIKHSALRSDTFSNWLAMNLDDNGRCRIFDTFFLDESSIIKNTSTKTYSYTENICNLCSRVHLMNATTFETNIMDIYNQVDMMYPSLLPKKWAIERDFCSFGTGTYWRREDGKPVMKYKRELRGYKNQELFKQRLKLVYFGRSKFDIGMDMPHIHMVYEVEPTTEQSMALSKGFNHNSVLNCPSLIPELGIPTTREDVPKIDRVCSLLESDFKDSSVMIYCFNIEAQEALARECKKLGRNPVILNGDTNDDERYTIQRGFNEKKYDVIITNIMKSLNLFGGDVCIFYSNDMTPSKMFQVAGRIDRNVDESIKTYVLLIYKGTDEYRHFVEVTKQRARDARDLTIDAKTTVDFFVDYMIKNESAT